tara:strand:+ start:2408 stop:2671 length:264 start_codon:yes stop_codon:yes gene_type:complete
MLDLIANIPAVLSVLAGILALFWGNGKLQRHKGRKQGRQDVNDELAEAYNVTTKEVRNAQTDIPSDPVAVLDSLREFAERGRSGSDT